MLARRWRWRSLDERTRERGPSDTVGGARHCQRKPSPVGPAAGGGPAVVVVIEWADLDRRLGVRHLGGWGTGVRADIIETVQIAADRVGAALEAVARDRHVAVCLPTLSLPPIGH